MTEEQRAVLEAAQVLYRMRHWRHESAATPHEMDLAMLALDRAGRALADAEQRARILANPLCKMGG